MNYIAKLFGFAQEAHPEGYIANLLSKVATVYDFDGDGVITNVEAVRSLVNPTNVALASTGAVAMGTGLYLNKKRKQQNAEVDQPVEVPFKKQLASIIADQAEKKAEGTPVPSTVDTVSTAKEEPSAVISTTTVSPSVSETHPEPTVVPSVEQTSGSSAESVVSTVLSLSPLSLVLGREKQPSTEDSAVSREPASDPALHSSDHHVDPVEEPVTLTPEKTTTISPASSNTGVKKVGGLLI